MKYGSHSKMRGMRGKSRGHGGYKKGGSLRSRAMKRGMRSRRHGRGTGKKAMAMKRRGRPGSNPGHY